MASRVPGSTTEGPPLSEPIFTTLYCAASCSWSETGAPCAPARDEEKTAAQTTAMIAGITLSNFCPMTRILLVVQPGKNCPALYRSSAFPAGWQECGALPRLRDVPC